MLRHVDDRGGYWFPAKRYGWGWGPPRTWQGWAVTGAYVLGVLVAIALDLPAWGRAAVVVGGAAVLVAVCWVKGEPPRWRWGSGDS
jgi:hypothetical protein